jgi:Zn-dependent peptidase ImmA (M78 family)
MANYVDVKPELLSWAVDRSGVPLPEFREAVAEWLNGQKKPTYNQLENFARQAMVPFGYLFLQRPPDEKLPLPDYRTRKGEAVRKPTPNLIETIFEMQRRQEWMKEFLLEQGHEPLPFVGSRSVGDNIRAVAKSMRKTLRLSENWAEKHATWEKALTFFRERIEESGILIFANGIVANNTRRTLDPDEFQGFVFVDPIVPLIFVNGADYKVAQMFTIAHELVHVWVGQSALFDLIATRPADFEVERYCNQVAAEFLVPGDKLKAAWPAVSGQDDAFAVLARKFKVSPIVIARRAKDKRLISKVEFFAFYRAYTSREKQKMDESTGGNFWLTQNVRLGRRFGEAVVTAVREGRLSYTEAYDLTRLYGDTFNKYAVRLRRTGG